MLKIGEFSKLTKVTVKTLRHYDRIGLLKPVFVDADSGYRFYDEGQAEQAAKILKLREIGLSTADVRMLLQEPGREREILSARAAEIGQELVRAEQQLGSIEDMLSRRELPTWQPKLRSISGCTAFCCRGYISSMAQLRSFITAGIREFRFKYPEIGYADEDYCCVIYPDDGFRSENIFVEYVQSVICAGEDGDIIKFREIEPVTAVCVEHRGNYEGLRGAYACALRFAAEQGLEVCGNARERYIDGYWNRENEADWLTEIQLPVRKREEGERT